MGGTFFASYQNERFIRFSLLNRIDQLIDIIRLTHADMQDVELQKEMVGADLILWQTLVDYFVDCHNSLLAIKKIKNVLMNILRNYRQIQFIMGTTRDGLYCRIGGLKKTLSEYGE